MLIASGLLALVVFSIGLVLVIAISDLTAAGRQQRRSERVIGEITELESLYAELRSNLQGYLLTGDEGFLRTRSATGARIDDVLQSIRALDPTRRIRTPLGIIEAELADYGRGWRRQVLAPGGSNPFPTAEVFNEVHSRLRGEAIEAKLENLIAQESRLDGIRELRSERQAERATSVARGGVAVLAAMVALFAVYLTRAVVAPIRSLSEAAGRLEMGDLQVRERERGGGEIRWLARTFNAMVTSLRQSRRQPEGQSLQFEVQALELARVLAQLKEEKASIETFNSFSRRLGAIKDLEPLAAAAITGICAVGGADIGALHVGNGLVDDNDPSLLVTHSLDPEPLRRRFYPDSGAAGQAIGEQKPMVVSHKTSAAHSEGLALASDVNHEVHVPLLQGTRVLGVVSIGRLSEQAFGPAALQTVERFVTQAALEIGNVVSLTNLERQASMNKAMLEASYDAFVALDGRGTISAWSPQAQASFGWSDAEVIGRRLSSTFIPPEANENGWDVLENLLSGGKDAAPGVPIELVARHKDGHEVPVELALSPVRSEGVSSFGAFVRDITGRKLTQRYVHAHHATTRVLAESPTMEEARSSLLAALVEGLEWDAGALWMAEGPGGRLRCDEVWHTPAVTYTDLEALNHVVTMASGTDVLAAVLEGKEVLWIEDIFTEGNVGRPQLAEDIALSAVLALPIVGDGNVLGVIVLFHRAAQMRDASLISTLSIMGNQIGHWLQRKHSESEADKQKGEFFALVSHELRTPLTSIVGYLDLILEAEADALGDELRDYLVTVDRNAKRLLSLVADLLFVARLDEGGLPLEFKDLDFVRLAEKALEAARPMAESKRLTLELSSQALAPYRGDAQRLGQTFDNLISNAVKFTPTGGRVEVRLGVDDGVLVVEVQDTGIGIPSTEQGHLFERFFRASTATHEAIPGVGLGLTIVKAIVEAHGGSTSVSSEVGEGTTFRLAFPPPPARDEEGGSEVAA